MYKFNRTLDGLNRLENALRNPVGLRVAAVTPQASISGQLPAIKRCGRGF